MIHEIQYERPITSKKNKGDIPKKPLGDSKQRAKHRLGISCAAPSGKQLNNGNRSVVQESGRPFNTQKGWRPAITMASKAPGRSRNRKRSLRQLNERPAASAAEIIGAGPLGKGGSM